MENLYLAHHGVLGQKWGVRRYQNRDGSLTKAGRKHRGLSLTPAKRMDPIKQAKAEGKAARIKAKQDAKLALAKAKEDAKLAKIRAKQDAEVAKIKEASKSPEERAKEKMESEQRFGKSTFKNLDKMSDQELQSAINRLRMEEQYRQLMNASMPLDKKMQKQLSTQEQLARTGKQVGDIGKEMVLNSLKTAGQEKLTDLMKYAMTKGINNLVQDQAITKDDGDKRAFLAKQIWAKNGYKSEYDPKNGSKNPYSDKYENSADARRGAELYALVKTGKINPHTMKDKDLKILVGYTKDLSSYKSNTDAYLGKNKGNGKSISEDRVREIAEEILEERNK